MALIDDEDYELIAGHNWFASNSRADHWYARMNLNGRTVLMHRFLTGGKFKQVDHINGDGLDNRRSNLREVTAIQNQQNRRKQRRKASSRYKGVCFVNKHQSWEARIYINTKQTYIGKFNNEEDAARAYDEVAKEHFGEFALLNLQP